MNALGQVYDINQNRIKESYSSDDINKTAIHLLKVRRLKNDIKLF